MALLDYILSQQVYAWINWVVLFGSIVLWLQYRKNLSTWSSIFFGLFLVFFFVLQILSHTLGFHWEFCVKRGQPASGIIELIKELWDSTLWGTRIRVLIALACGFSAFVAFKIVSSSNIVNDIKSPDENLNRFLLTMITSASMLTLIVAITPITKYVITLGGVLVTLASFAVSMYYRLHKNKEVHFMCILFVFFCGTIMGLLSFVSYLVSWPFIATLVYGTPVALSLGFHFIYKRL